MTVVRELNMSPAQLTSMIQNGQSANREVFVSYLPKLLSQYNEQADTFSNNVRFSWLQSANAGLFIVYNEIDERGIGAPPRGREFIIKYSRIFDVFN